jgi:hypothetical protein
LLEASARQEIPQHGGAAGFCLVAESASKYLPAT